jgi:phage terminase large subunit-like protein
VAEVLERNTLERWRAQPITFIEQILRDPETGHPFQLFDAQRRFFEHAWTLTDDGRLRYPEQCFGAPKKTGKTGTAAMHLLTTTCLYGGRFSEAYCVANDLEQAQGRVFQSVRRIVEASPYLRREAEVTQQRITFPQTGAVIQAIGSDYASAAGANPVISSFDELWGYTSERSHRLWDEMVPSPARKVSCRLVTTYAGFEGESNLLFDLYKRGIAQGQVGPELYAGDGLLMAWHRTPQAPWQTEGWLAEMRRSLRPNQFLRMIENQFVTTESSFISMAAWDRCVDPGLGTLMPSKLTRLYVGVDASTKHDSSAIVGVTWDKQRHIVRLAFHRVFQPTPEEPLDFEQTIEATLLDLHKRFAIVRCLFDPFQMQATAQRLMKAGLPIEEFPQSSPNLTSASQNLYELIQAQQLLCYADPGMRLAISRAVALETPRGWRISKTTQSHKIDVVVALAMASHAAVLYQNEYGAGEYLALIEKAYC